MLYLLVLNFYEDYLIIYVCFLENTSYPAEQLSREPPNQLRFTKPPARRRWSGVAGKEDGSLYFYFQSINYLMIYRVLSLVWDYPIVSSMSPSFVFCVSCWSVSCMVLVQSFSSLLFSSCPYSSVSRIVFVHVFVFINSTSLTLPFVLSLMSPLLAFCS